MKQLTNDDIDKNRVETVEQYKVLQYIKDNLNILQFKLFLCDRYTIKVVDSDNKIAYFKFKEDSNEVLFLEEQ